MSPTSVVYIIICIILYSVRMQCMYIYLFLNFQEIGFVNVGLKYEHASGRLTVKVDEAKSLQHHPITGPPSKRTIIYVFRIVYSRVL